MHDCLLNSLRFLIQLPEALFTFQIIIFISPIKIFWHLIINYGDFPQQMGKNVSSRAQGNGGFEKIN